MICLTRPTTRGRFGVAASPTAEAAAAGSGLGITAAIRDRLLAACGTDLAGLRNRAMIAMGFDALCAGVSQWRFVRRISS